MSIDPRLIQQHLALAQVRKRKTDSAAVTATVTLFWAGRLHKRPWGEHRMMARVPTPEQSWALSAGMVKDLDSAELGNA
jgi:hypothetical protein